MKKKTTLIAVPLLAATLVGFGAYGVSNAYAENKTNLPPFMEKITERFNLDQDEVHEFVQEQREEHRAEREASFEKKMTEAVENGELTQEQVTAIESKHEELRLKREAVRDQDLSREDRRDAMHEIRDEMRTWVEEQGLEDVMPKPEEGGRKGRGQGPRF